MFTCYPIMLHSPPPPPPPPPLPGPHAVHHVIMLPSPHATWSPHIARSPCSMVMLPGPHAVLYICTCTCSYHCLHHLTPVRTGWRLSDYDLHSSSGCAEQAILQELSVEIVQMMECGALLPSLKGRGLVRQEDEEFLFDSCCSRRQQNQFLLHLVSQQVRVCVHVCVCVWSVCVCVCVCVECVCVCMCVRVCVCVCVCDEMWS